MIMTAATCLALAVYYEARGEEIDAQKAVAEVVLTRAAHSDFPMTVCGVVTEHRTPETRPWACQFRSTATARATRLPTRQHGSQRRRSPVRP